ncbi:cupin domain-containing protein [Rhodospirillaceae bacterium KN72]|uniref:Cupin domain-containing protein n=1 Tax=Pacificispira spongiicola TaxID=2729598 RepID=A0A7Y0HDN0_9PROT|nr:cupin domain-containing protein [Pacificispira spongiicola]NMM43820.1 cupin domain-containing protein [Pacificispira spongiicola]
MNPVLTLDDEFAQITEYFSPRVVALANGQYVKLAKMKGEFVRHNHENEDEFFFVIKGTFCLRYDDGSEAVLKAGQCHVTPRGVWHHPHAPEEAWVLFVEPAETLHTGTVDSPLSVSVDNQAAHLRQED